MKMWHAIVYFFESGLYLKVFVFFLFATITWIAIKLQRATNQIRWEHLLIGEDGKGSNSKIYALGAFAVSTWAFGYLTVIDHLTEWFFTSYMVCWTGTQLANKWLSAKENTPPPDPVPVTVQTDGARVDINQPKGPMG